MKVRNTFIIFIFSGFWHGANWTFIVWGALNALFIMPSVLFKTNRRNLDIVAQGKYIPSLREFFAMAITFSLTVFAWIFFRAKNLTEAVRYIAKIFSKSIFSLPEIFPTSLILITVIFVVIEWFGRERQFAISHLGQNWGRVFRWALYFGIITLVFIYAGKEQKFIYFQF